MQRLHGSTWCGRSGLIAGAAAGLFVMMSSSASAGVIYVDDDAPLLGDGQSWETAYKYLQDAMAVAQPLDEVRVAQGIYRPDRKEGDIIVPDLRAATFQLLDDVTLLGGYAGIGAGDPDERNVGIYKTVLSGDLLGNDPPESIDGPSFENYDENSYHVVTASGVSATAVLDGFTIQAGFAEERNGAGMFFETGSPVLRNCTFRRNLATGTEAHFTGLGGGVFGVGVGAPLLERCFFIGNKAFGEFSDITGSGGGATFGFGMVLILNDCNFEGNLASARGGGLWLWEAQADLTRCAFTNNEVSADLLRSEGGAVYTIGTEVTITESQFAGNSADAGGGLCAASWGSVTIIDSRFTENEATADGGALMLSLLPHVTLTNVEFSTNDATRGGAVYVFGVANVTMANVLFARNEAEAGGAIFNYNGFLVLTNVTFADNVATATEEDGGGGMYNLVQSFASVRNSIFWGNTGGQIVDADTSSTTVDFCDVQDGWPGKGNIAVDAAFVDPANGDYRLANGSPCIDAGHNNAVPSDSFDLDEDLDYAERTPFDLDGDPRFANDEDADDTGCGRPAVVDMGAFEHDGVPEHPVYVGDVDGDGQVTFADLLEVLSTWGACIDDCCMADVDFDLEVGFDDLLLVLSNWS